jgi:hypothetical protein
MKYAAHISSLSQAALAASAQVAAPPAPEDDEAPPAPEDDDEAPPAPVDAVVSLPFGLLVPDELHARRPIEAITNTPNIDPKRIVRLHRAREGRSPEPCEVYRAGHK